MIGRRLACAQLVLFCDRVGASRLYREQYPCWNADNSRINSVYSLVHFQADYQKACVLQKAEACLQKARIQTSRHKQSREIFAQFFKFRGFYA